MRLANVPPKQQKTYIKMLQNQLSGDEPPSWVLQKNRETPKSRIKYSHTSDVPHLQHNTPANMEISKIFQLGKLKNKVGGLITIVSLSSALSGCVEADNKQNIVDEEVKQTQKFEPQPRYNRTSSKHTAKQHKSTDTTTMIIQEIPIISDSLLTQTSDLTQTDSTTYADLINNITDSTQIDSTKIRIDTFNIKP